MFLLLVVGMISENEVAERKAMHPSRDTVAVAVQISAVDDRVQGVSVDNSRVLVKTTAINKIVQEGKSALPVLVAIMKNENVCFDTFVRCYSACDQILCAQDPGLVVYWSGGVESARTRSGIVRFSNRGLIDEHEFRARVIRDIVDKAKLKE
jgi:hypothetical protein